jgi:hypothetical protein
VMGMLCMTIIHESIQWTREACRVVLECPSWWGHQGWGSPYRPWKKWYGLSKERQLNNWTKTRAVARMDWDPTLWCSIADPCRLFFTALLSCSSLSS